MSTPQVSSARCWCGGATTPAAHPLYGTCTRCQTQVLLRQFSAEELKAFYSADYWHDFVQGTNKAPSIEERAVNDFYDRLPFYFRMLLRYTSLPKSILEIGCSHGGFLYYCRKCGVPVVDGIEVDPGTCAFAKDRFGLDGVVPGFFPDVALPRERYDVVVGFDVLEHFIDPLEVMTAVAQKIDEKGICFFLTPCYRNEDQSWDRYRPDEHTFLYTEQAISELYDRSGLEVVDLLPGLFSQDMYIVGRKKRAGIQKISQRSAGTSQPVSVIVTTNNHLDLLDSALRSIVTQTMGATQIVVVNRGTADVTPVIAKYSSGIEIVLLSCPTTATLSAARNAGIAAATGEWVAFLNDGEKFYPTHLEILLEQLSMSEAPVAAAYADAYRSLQVPRGASYFTFRHDLVFANDFDAHRLLSENLFPLECSLIRRSCFSDIGLFDDSLEFCGDWDFWARFSKKYAAQHSKRITCEYLMRTDGSLSSPQMQNAFVNEQNSVYQRYCGATAGSPALHDPQRNRLPSERDPSLPYPRMDAFMNTIVALVEKGELAHAVQYYSSVRPQMPPSPELSNFDQVMEKLNQR